MTGAFIIILKYFGKKKSKPLDENIQKYFRDNRKLFCFQ